MKLLNCYWLIDHLPTPREWRIRWLRLYLDWTYGKDIRAARSVKDAEGQERVHSEWGYEIALLNEEADERFTKQMLKQASHLRVRIPNRYEKSKLTDDYEETPLRGLVVLSTEGGQKIREEIRKELKWRGELRAQWLPYVTAVTGLLGTATGLIAVWHK